LKGVHFAKKYQTLRGCFFSIIDGIIFNDLQKLSQPGHNVRKNKLVNSFSASFKTITRQTVEMTQRK